MVQHDHFCCNRLLDRHLYMVAPFIRLVKPFVAQGLQLGYFGRLRAKVGPDCVS